MHFAKAAKAAVKECDIILHTEGNSISNFVYLSDAITAILLILIKGGSGEAYNICNDKETRSVKQIAHLVANYVACGKISVRIKKEDGQIDTKVSVCQI